MLRSSDDISVVYLCVLLHIYVEDTNQDWFRCRLGGMVPILPMLPMLPEQAVVNSNFLQAYIQLVPH